MKHMPRILLIAVLFSILVGLQSVQGFQVKTDNAEVELISEQSSVTPGESFWIGVRMDIRDGWYVYYRNPGDSGQPMMVNWTHGEDFNISGINWPYPKWKDVSGGLTSYAYQDSILYMMEAVAPDDLQPGSDITLKAETEWLICDDICIPEFADLELTLPVEETSQMDENWLPYFSETRQKLPADLDFWQATADVDGDTATLTLTTDAFELPDYSNVIYFANKEGEIENGADQPFSVEGNTLTIELEKSTYKSGDIERLWGLVYNEEGWDESGRIKAMNVDVNVGEQTENLAAAPSGSVGSPRFLMILGFAFLGGLILNLMPCVFPILSIKMINFLQISGDNPGKAKLHGWVFGAGVLLSFLLLAGLLLLLRAGGQELGWGFQLQTPAFIAFMTFLMFALGLSLMGVFEIGNSLMNVAGSAKTGDGIKGSFFSGVLATVLATPCTAPFMGTALGAAITLSAPAALLVFAFLGFGMAAPYIILSSFPALMRILPKPGAWMETFKQLMAFPLFATAIWLAWVYGQQTGVSGLTNLLIGLLMLSMGIWILNRWQVTRISGRSRIISRVFVTLLVIGGFLFSSYSTIDSASGTNGANSGLNSYGIEWIAYSEDILDKHLAENRNVFIDFTADWCITCKANERVVFSSDEVKQAFRDMDFVMIKADWTNRNPEITRALESFGRNGVPLYVIHSEGLEEPKILPELLTPGIVLNTLKSLPDANRSLSMNDR